MSLKALAYDWLGLNEILFLSINGWLPAGWEMLARVGSAIGNYWAAPVIVLALLLWARQTRNGERAADIRRRAAVFGWAFLLAFGLTAWIKWGLDFQRPGAALGAAAHVRVAQEASHGFPSGHSVYAMLVVGAAWPLFGLGGRLVLVAGLLWVGYARVALGAHFPADVAAGWLLGWGCVALTSTALARIPRLHRVPSLRWHSPAVLSKTGDSR